MPSRVVVLTDKDQDLLRMALDLAIVNVTPVEYAVRIIDLKGRLKL